MILALFGISLMSWMVFLVSLLLQYALGLEPCPLCIMQRLSVLLVALCLSMWCWRAYHGKGYRQTFWAGASLSLACCGLYFSLRQVWLQSLPPEQVPACMPSLSVMLDFLPWQTIAKTLLFGAGDCAQQGFLIAGWSLAAWSSLYFVVVLACLWGLYFRRWHPMP